jgi:cbb3-type cytochrome oxidase cytochrome c subunit
MVFVVFEVVLVLVVHEEAQRAICKIATEFFTDKNANALSNIKSYSQLRMRAYIP